MSRREERKEGGREGGREGVPMRERSMGTVTIHSNRRVIKRGRPLEVGTRGT